jgi:hypothetical protein
MSPLTWEEWQKRANAEYEKGKRGAQEMIKDWGYPEGMSADTYKIEFDKGKVKRKGREVRKANRAKAEAKRSASLTAQTVGPDVYSQMVESLGERSKEFDIHHKRTAVVYQPFFEGLSPKEQKELAQYAADIGMPLGNVAENLVEAQKTAVHDPMHQWMKENYIQPDSGKPLLDFTGKSLDFRKKALKLYGEFVQPAVDEQLNKLEMDFSGGAVKTKRVTPSRAEMKGLAGAGKLLAGFGLVGGVLSAGEAFAAGDTKEGVARTLETVAGEVPVVGDIVQSESLAAGDMSAPMEAEERMRRRREVEQRSAEARQRGSKWKANIGGMEIGVPELGVSEWLGIN